MGPSGGAGRQDGNEEGQQESDADAHSDTQDPGDDIRRQGFSECGFKNAHHHQ